jgi:Pentapeptide repeats (9 copies)
MIRAGAGEDFLQADFENHELGFLENMWDLKGINIHGESLTLGGRVRAGSRRFDFSFAQFYHSRFRGAAFNSTFQFTRIYNCEFVDCTFSFTGFYAVTLEKVTFRGCNFIEHNSFTNCDLQDVKFDNCFMPESIFSDCCFDANTIVSDPLERSLRTWNLTLDKRQLAGIFQGLKDGYLAGSAFKQSRKYLFRQNQANTRYNKTGPWDAISGYALEYLTGYGVRPLRVLAVLVLLVAAGIGIFSPRVGFENALILASGGFFTFGGYVDLLKCLPIFYKVLYVLMSFAGMFLTGLYVTVWANVWFRERRVRVTQVRPIRRVFLLSCHA